MKINTLGYLGFESPNHKEWESFGPEIFGLGLNEPGADGTVYLRMDDRHHRIALHPGSEDRLAYIGWELRDKKAFRDAIAELESERSHFDLTLQEERQSAAKGIELLLMAQENLKRVFRHMQPEKPAENGESNGNGHVLVGAVASDSPAE